MANYRPYTILSLVSRRFVIYTPTQEYYLRKYVTGKRIEYKLPNGKYHSPTYDRPALIQNNDQHWYKNGKWHRDRDLPAVIYFDGVCCWYYDGTLHRDNDLPAIIHPNGYQEWYIHGARPETYLLARTYKR
jgi:hypothetical protein